MPATKQTRDSGNDVKTKSSEAKDRAVVILHNPKFQKATVATTGGSITFGAVGGAFGLASGVVVGSTVGLVPALFTLGLSIPVGGVVLGVGGLCAGTLIGGTSGGVAGFTIYKYHILIENGVMIVRVKARDLLSNAKSNAIQTYNRASARAASFTNEYNGVRQALSDRVRKFHVSISDLVRETKTKSRAALELARSKASKALHVTAETRKGVTTASAVTGAVIGGTGGGALGTVAGAAVGIVPAVFTFGLSIPVGAMVGLCAGTVVGGSAGAVGGGVVGYTGYTVKQRYGKAITESIQASLNRVSAKAGGLEDKHLCRAAESTASISSLRASTGGSDSDGSRLPQAVSPQAQALELNGRPSFEPNEFDKSSALNNTGDMPVVRYFTPFFADCFIGTFGFGIMSEEEMRTAFGTIDVNSNGSLDKREISDALREAGKSERFIKRFVKNMTVDSITFEEFKALIEGKFSN